MKASAIVEAWQWTRRRASRGVCSVVPAKGQAVGCLGQLLGCSKQASDASASPIGTGLSQVASPLCLEVQLTLQRHFGPTSIARMKLYGVHVNGTDRRIACPKMRHLLVLPCQTCCVATLGQDEHAVARTDELPGERSALPGPNHSGILRAKTNKARLLSLKGWTHPGN